MAVLLLVDTEPSTELSGQHVQRVGVVAAVDLPWGWC